jgi:hypothetical protein
LLDLNRTYSGLEHAHSSQPDQLLLGTVPDAVRPAVAAKAAAERTRKNLVESASALAGEAAEEAYIVEVESNEDSDKRKHERLKQPRTRTAPAKLPDGDRSVEDWV